MIRISINEQGVGPRLLTYSQESVTLGRAEDCDLQLTGKGVSSRHCRIRRTPQGTVVEDLGSTNGTYINRRRVDQPIPVTAQDLIVLAIYELRVLEDAAGGGITEQPVPRAPTAPTKQAAPSVQTAPHPPPSSGPTALVPGPTGPITAAAPGPITASPSGPMPAGRAGPITPGSPGPTGPIATAGGTSAAPPPATTDQVPMLTTGPSGDVQLSPDAVAFAREWEKIDSLSRNWLQHNRDRRLLLRGAKLKHARAWLAKGRSQKRRPKREHRDFILSSSRSSQLRVFVRVMIGGLVLGAGAVAAIQLIGREEALTLEPGATLALSGIRLQEGKVDPDAVVAASNAIAERARRIIDNDPVLAALLAAEALRRVPEAKARGSQGERVLREALGKLRGRPLRGHEGPVLAVGFSPNGRWAITGSGDSSHGTARLWDRAPGGSRRPVALAGHAKPVRFLGVTNDSRYLFTAGDGNLMFRWDLKNSQPQTTSVMIREHDGPVTAMAVSADGSMLATGTGEGSIRVWDPASSPPTSQETRAHDGAITALSANRNGSLVASASDDMRGAVWPVQGGAAGRRRPLDGHEAGVLSVALSEDGQWVLTGAEDGTAKLWNATRRIPALGHFTLLGHEGPVTQVAISPDSVVALTASADKTVRVWELNDKDPSLQSKAFDQHTAGITALSVMSGVTPEDASQPFISLSASKDGTARTWKLERRSFEQDGATLAGHEGPVNTAAISSDGNLVITGGDDRTARLWDYRSDTPGGASRVGRGHASQVLAVAVAPAGHRMITGGADGTSRFWDITGTGALEQVAMLDEKQPGAVEAVAIGPSGRFAATAGADGIVRLWGIETDKPRARQMPGHKGEVNALAFGPDRILVSIGADKTARVWNLGTAAPEKNVKVLRHDSEVTVMQIGGDGKSLITGSITEVKLWDLSLEEPRAHLLKGHGRDIEAVALDPNGRWAASSSVDAVLFLWKITDKGIKKERLRHHQEPVDALAFSPDGRWLATGSRDKTIRLWDLSKKHPEDKSLLLRGHTERVEQLHFFENWLVSVSNDNTIRLWNTGSGDQAAITASSVVLSGHAGLIRDVALAAQGTFIASASYDGTARVWPLRPEELIAITCDKTGRDLTGDEWSKYLGADARALCE